MKVLLDAWRAFTATPLRTRMIAVAVVTIALIFLLINTIGAVQYRYYTCAECRLYEKRVHCLKWEWKDIQDNACHQWFASNLSEPHEHLWIPGTEIYGRDLLSYYWRDIPGSASFGYNPDSRPIWLISSDEQLAIYHSAPDRKSAIRAFRAFYLAWRL